MSISSSRFVVVTYCLRGWDLRLRAPMLGMETRASVRHKSEFKSIGTTGSHQKNLSGMRMRIRQSRCFGGLAHSRKQHSETHSIIISIVLFHSVICSRALKTNIIRVLRRPLQPQVTRPPVTARRLLRSSEAQRPAYSPTLYTQHTNTARTRHTAEGTLLYLHSCTTTT